MEVTLVKLLRFSRKCAGETTPCCYDEWKRQFDKEYFSNLLRYCRGNVTMAGRICKRDRSTVYHIIKRCDIDPEDFRLED